MTTLTLPAPLQQTLTIPNFGVVMTVNGLLQTLCAAANLDPSLCNLITKSPDKACSALIAKGDTWLKARIKEAFNALIAEALQGVNCKSSDWKAQVVGALHISFTDENINIDIDTNAIVQSVICAVANKVVSVALDQPVNVAVRALKNACAKLGGSSGSSSTTSTTSSGLSQTSQTSNMTQQQLADAVADALAHLHPPPGIVQPTAQPSQRAKITKVFATTFGIVGAVSGAMWLIGKKKSR